MATFKSSAISLVCLCMRFYQMACVSKARKIISSQSVYRDISHHFSKQSSIAPNCVSESLIYACTSNFLSHAITNLKVPLIFLFYDSTSCLWYFLQLKWNSTTENASIVGILRYFNKDKRLLVIFQNARILALNFNNQLLHTHFGAR